MNKNGKQIIIPEIIGYMEQNNYQAEHSHSCHDQIIQIDLIFVHLKEIPQIKQYGKERDH